MRHRMAGRYLGRTPSHRLALRRNMAASLFEHGAIKTTEAKAKELRRFAEKLITIARQGTLHARRRVIAEMQNWHRHEFDDNKGRRTRRSKTVVDKLFDEIAPRYADRPGGYTRIIRLAERRIGDAGTQVLLQLVEETPTESGKSRGSSRRRQRAAKRYEAVGGKASRSTKTEQVVEADVEPAIEEVAGEQPQDAAPEAAAEEAAPAAEADAGAEEKPKDSEG